MGREGRWEGGIEGGGGKNSEGRKGTVSKRQLESGGESG